MLAQKDNIYAEAVDLSGGRIDCPCGVAFFAASPAVRTVMCRPAR